MHRKVIDRTGMECINNFGSKMIIVGYRNKIPDKLYQAMYNWEVSMDD